MINLNPDATNITAQRPALPCWQLLAAALHDEYFIKCQCFGSSAGVSVVMVEVAKQKWVEPCVWSHPIMEMSVCCSV